MPTVYGGVSWSISCSLKAFKEVTTSSNSYLAHLQIWNAVKDVNSRGCTASPLDTQARARKKAAERKMTSDYFNKRNLDMNTCSPSLCLTAISSRDEKGKGNTVSSEEVRQISQWLPTVLVFGSWVTHAWLSKLNAELFFPHFRYKNPKLVPIPEHYWTSCFAFLVLRADFFKLLGFI